MARAPDIEAHWGRLRDMGCIVSGRPNPTIHHCHGGSMLLRGITKGAGLKTSDWLVIPLAVELHSIGPSAIDGIMGVPTWEFLYGTQAEYLDRISKTLGVDVWAKAEAEHGDQP